MDDDVKRISINVSKSRYEQLQNMAAACDMATQKELLNAAMTLFNWAVDESLQGRNIGSFSDDDNIVKLLMPPLEDLRKRNT